MFSRNEELRLLPAAMKRAIPEVGFTLASFVRPVLNTDDIIIRTKPLAWRLWGPNLRIHAARLPQTWPDRTWRRRGEIEIPVRHELFQVAADVRVGLGPIGAIPDRGASGSVGQQKESKL